MSTSFLHSSSKPWQYHIYLEQWCSVTMRRISDDERYLHDDDYLSQMRRGEIFMMTCENNVPLNCVRITNSSHCCMITACIHHSASSWMLIIWQISRRRSNEWLMHPSRSMTAMSHRTRMRISTLTKWSQAGLARTHHVDRAEPLYSHQQRRISSHDKLMTPWHRYLVSV